MRSPARDTARVVTDTDAILDGPDQAGSQKDIRTREALAHEVAACIPKRYFDVTQLLSEVFACFFDDAWCRAVDVGQALLRPVPPHDIQAREIEL